MLIDTNYLPPPTANARTQARRTADGPPTMIDAYLPADKAEKYKSYDALAQDTRTWQASLKTRGIYEADLARMSKAGDDTLPILKKALDAQAFADPKAFLKTLSGPELQALQYAHSLASPINVDGLSQEGALNLLLPPNDARMDTDGDGLVSVGDARDIVFPPANAPKAVDDAWDEAMAGASEQERAHLEMTMFLSPRATLQADGQAGSGNGPGLEGLASFRSLVSRALEGLEVSRRFQSEQQRAFTDRIGNLLEKFDKALATREAQSKTSAAIVS